MNEMCGESSGNVANKDFPCFRFSLADSTWQYLIFDLLQLNLRWIVNKILFL